jgi:C4-dicarboxylate-binding protein DctP
MTSKANKGGLGRRAFLKAGTGAMALGMTMGAPLVARAQQKFVCRMGHSEAIGSPLTDAFEKWKNLLNEKSGGRIDAQHFPASQLGSYTQNIEQNRLGTIQVSTGGPDTEESIAPEIAATGGAPGFIFKDDAHVDRVLQGDIGREVSRIAREKTGIEFVDYGEVGFRHILAKRKVTNIDEIKGLKIRVPELKIWVDFWKKLGANPTPLPYAEQYSALSTGLIDALEADVFSIKGFKWGEQAKHFTYTSHWFLPKATRVNARWLDSLPADLQKLVRESAKEIFAEQRKVNRANSAKTLEELKASGITVYQLSDTPKWAAATESLFDEFGAKSPATKAMIEKIRGLAKSA